MYKMHINSLPQGDTLPYVILQPNFEKMDNTRNEEKYLVPKCRLDVKNHSSQMPFANGMDYLMM